MIFGFFFLLLILIKIYIQTYVYAYYFLLPPQHVFNIFLFEVTSNRFKPYKVSTGSKHHLNHNILLPGLVITFMIEAAHNNSQQMKAQWANLSHWNCYIFFLSCRLSR